MTECRSRRHDRRTVEQILTTGHAARWRDLPGIRALPLRELRSLDRFLGWCAREGVETPSVADLLAFAEECGTRRTLIDLRSALGRVLPDDAPLREAVRAAIRARVPRSRACDRRSRAQIVAAAHFDPFRHLDGFDMIALEDLRVLDRFLVFAEQRGIESPTPEDFLAFTRDTRSSRRLRSLETALRRILPGNPAIVLTLREAIRLKSPTAPPATDATPARPARKARLSLPRAALPQDWQRALEALHHPDPLADPLADTPALAPSTLRNLEEVLRAYAHTLASAGQAIALSVEGLRLHEAALRARGARPATLHNVTLRLRQFARAIGAAPELIEALASHEAALRRKLRHVLPLKEARLAALPPLADIWHRARTLLDRAGDAHHRATRTRLRNEAFCLAFWTLVPLRLGDSRLRWGRHVQFDGDHYHIDIVTRKCGVPLRGRLHPNLTPFLDALVLGDVAADYLDEMRALAMREAWLLLRRANGAPCGQRYPSAVWRRHLGTGAHIARSRVHTELGRLGPEGVEAALALCAQADPDTRRHYQGRALADAQMRRGQEMIEELLDTLAKEAAVPSSAARPGS